MNEQARWTIGLPLGFAALFTIVLNVARAESTPAVATNKLQCQIAQENSKVVDAEGYKFSILSNLGKSRGGDRQCLQQVIRNEPESPSFNFAWTYDSDKTVFESDFIASCHNKTTCICKETRCQ